MMFWFWVCRSIDTRESRRRFNFPQGPSSTRAFRAFCSPPESAERPFRCCASNAVAAGRESTPNPKSLRKPAPECRSLNASLLHFVLSCSGREAPTKDGSRKRTPAVGVSSPRKTQIPLLSFPFHPNLCWGPRFLSGRLLPFANSLKFSLWEASAAAPRRRQPG